MGHVLGAANEFFLIRGRGRPTVNGGRTSGILSIRGPEISLGLPMVGTVHVQSPTPHTPPLPAYFGQFSHHCAPKNHELLGNGFQCSRTVASTAYAVQATTHNQTYPERPPGADLPPKKACNLDPMAPRPRKIRNYPRAPSSRRSGLVGPYTTPTIVNYEYMPSTL